jgi:site-specific DNA-methyltransferase (adenine-specific)
MDKNIVIHGDSLEYMKSLPDKCIDLVLTDPPYGIGISWQKQSINEFNSKANRKYYEDKWWDLEIPKKEYFDEIFRISKNQIIWGWNYFVEHLSEWHKWWIMWDKWQHWLTMSDWELAYTSFDSPLRVYVMNRVYLQRDNPKHPTQKPKELFKWCLENYSKPWDLILDCFAWSGTTWVACLETWRDYILIEKEADYVEIINKRLKNTNTPLFAI